MGQAISKEKLEKMEPHEDMAIGLGDDNGNGVRMMRVVGGWIYWRTNQYATEGAEGTSGSVSCAIAGVFVPEP